MKLNIKTIFLIMIVAVVCLSCKKGEFLKAKPDQSLIIPTTIADFQALLDNETEMNGTGSNGVLPTFGEIASDNYFVRDAYLNATSDRYLIDVYTYGDDFWNIGAGSFINEWDLPYRAIFYSNVSLDALKDIKPKASELEAYNNVKGSALFHRAHMFYLLAQIFAVPYNTQTAKKDLGIPLRLSGDLNEKIYRPSVQENYDRIIQDLNEALILLPKVPFTKTRPSQAAVFGLLARVYLTMGDYNNALSYSDKCLKESNTLMDYNDINASLSFPFPPYNVEVILSGVLNSSTVPLLVPGISTVDAALYASYDNDDLRKKLYFSTTSSTGIRFKGSYDNTRYLFGGIAVDEIYLIRAECYARTGDKDRALQDLNTLMKKRWLKTVPFPTITASDPNNALQKILIERRKELLFRGLRWIDIRRLNLEGANISLSKTLNGKKYEILPNSPKFTFLIPPSVMALNPSMQQNPR